MSMNKTGTLVLFLIASIAWGAPVIGEKKAVQFYQGALESYLSGEYEQAILLDSQALQADPNYKKAKALLDVLVKEKEKMKKSEIWLKGDDKLQVPLPGSVTRTQKVIVRQELDKEKLQELESRIQTVGLLMERDSIDRYHELSDNQAQNSMRLEGVTKQLADLKAANNGKADDIEKEFGINYLLSLLAIILSLLALWDSRQTRKEQKRQLALLNRVNALDELGNVVNIHK